MRHKEPWAHHALAHVMLTQGRLAEGHAFMAAMSPTWTGLNSFMETHNWWHLALFALEQNLRPDAFQPLLACMMAHNDTRKTCDLTLWSADPGDCLEGWHQKVAVDPATATTCRRVTGACKKSGTGSLSMADCQGMLSATAARGERKMIACMTEYCDEAPKLCTMAFD